MYPPSQIRNIAIVAHVDHGKTTLIDQLLRQSQNFRENEKIPERAMDSFDQEKERGITIFAKHTTIFYESDKSYKINVIDTPGHADFSGEVERALRLVNGILLVVDAQEGPMPQTRFVLSQALQAGLNPIVVLNKIDRSAASINKVIDAIFDLFVELGASDKQLDFPILYLSALKGYAVNNLNDPAVDLKPVFDTIVRYVPPPLGDPEAPFLMQTVNIAPSEYFGAQASGCISQGRVRKGDLIARVNGEGKVSQHKVLRLGSYIGLKTEELVEASVGDIVQIAGIPDLLIGDTLCSIHHIVQLPRLPDTEQMITIAIMVNNGPFAGKEGVHVTMNKIRERLLKEKRGNTSLAIVEPREDLIEVAGKGELHLAVLLESMRREGFELLISKPKVILKTIDGVEQEPFEEVYLHVETDLAGTIVHELSQRGGMLIRLENNEEGNSTIIFHVPARGLLGYRNQFLNLTRGKGIYNSSFHSYAPKKNLQLERPRGSLVSISRGKVTAYAAYNLQSRGALFVEPGNEVYEGMVVGEHVHANDLLINITKEKALTNVRSSGKDKNIILTPPRKLSLETAIQFIREDELVEITPLSIRVRKEKLGDRK